MTPERLTEIITGGETLDVEFKGEGRARLSDDDLVKAVVCLANRAGGNPGYLLVGVEDDGRVTGLQPRHEGGRTDLARVQALIANKTRPSVTVRVGIVEVEGRAVLVIEVPPSRRPVGTAEGHYLRRTLGGRGEPGCVPYHFHEMQAREADAGSLDYSALTVSGATWADLDPLEFDRFRRSIREARGDESLLVLPDVELAKALGAVEANHEVRAVRVLALLLFGHEDALRRFFPTHEAAFQVLSGTQVEVNDFFRWPLLRTMEEMLSRFRARNSEQEVTVGLLRVGVPDYPERAFREALANALVHRDYTRVGAVHVQWHDDRIEIGNPGGFPAGVRLDNLLVVQPHPRNPLLADAFKRAGIVERTGRGVDTIFLEQIRNGRPAPSYDRSTESDVVVVFPGGAANLDFVKIVAEEGQAGRDLRLDDVLCLNALWQERALTVDRVSRLIQKPDHEARAVLARLVEAGLVETRGNRGGRSFHLSASTYRRMGERAAYVRQRDFEPLQCEQMILRYIRENGHITRREAAELCRLGPYQATRILDVLVRRGEIERHGQKRGTRYALRS